MYQKESPSTIQSMFNNIAKRYDLTNHILSFSMHKYWNRQLVKATLQNTPNHTYLDLCSGTGDIAFDYLKCVKNPCQAYLIDFSSEMLEQAKLKGKQKKFDTHSTTFIEADVLQLPLIDQMADCATMAYGIRNVQDPYKCLEEVYRVLKPGGCFAILELTRPENRFLNFGHQLYLKTMLPVFGKLLTKNQDAYQYLCQSIHRFTAPTELEKMMKEIGYVNTEKCPLSGGVATIIKGCKPS